MWSTVFFIQRSYRKDLFDDAVGKMFRAKIKTETERERFRILQSKVDALVVEKQRAEVDYGDIPDEFRGKLKWFPVLPMPLFLWTARWYCRAVHDDSQ